MLKQIKVSRYTVLNYDGEQYEVCNDLVVSDQHRLLVRSASDYEVNEKFTRRADGTNMLLNSNGELIVRFPGMFQHACHFAERIPISAPYYTISMRSEFINHVEIQCSMNKGYFIILLSLIFCNDIQ